MTHIVPANLLCLHELSQKAVGYAIQEKLQLVALYVPAKTYPAQVSHDMLQGAGSHRFLRLVLIALNSITILLDQQVVFVHLTDAFFDLDICELFGTQFVKAKALLTSLQTHKS